MCCDRHLFQTSVPVLEIDNSEELGSCIPPTIDSKLTSLEMCIVDLGGGFWSPTFGEIVT